MEHGSRGVFMPGLPLTVAAGKETVASGMQLTPHAIVTGRVLDDEGEPLAQVQIQLMRPRFVQGRRQLMPSGGGQTMDTGEFRVADLPPGRYWVSANPRSLGMFGVSTARDPGGKPEEVFVTTYHPSSN